jgi:hypothetical protein
MILKTLEQVAVMSYLVRKIAPAKWSSVQSLEYLSADALTADLRTANNTLSLWEIDSENKLNDVILALAVSKNATKIEKMDLVLIPKETILAQQLSIRPSSGDTFAEGLSDTHREIVDLRYPSLGVVAQIIIDLLSKTAPTTITKKQVENIVQAAYNDQVIDISCLPESIQKTIKNNINPKPVTS